MFVVAASVLAACGTGPATPAAPAGTFPLTVERCGHEATFKKPPERVLTIGTEAFNLMVAVGAPDKIAARAGSPGVPSDRLASSGAQDAPEITAKDPSTEVILGAGVDAVLHYGLFNSSPDDLAASGLPSLQVRGACAHGGTSDGSPVRWDMLYEDLELYGRLFGTEAKAADAVSGLRKRVAAVETEVAGRRPLTVASLYFFRQTPKAHGKYSMSNLQMETLRLTNVFGDVPKYSAEVNIEELLARDPDMLIIVNYNAQRTFEDVRREMLALPGLSGLRAVRDNRIVEIDGLQTQPDPTAVDGLEAMLKQLGDMT